MKKFRKYGDLNFQEDVDQKNIFFKKNYNENL